MKVTIRPEGSVPSAALLPGQSFRPEGAAASPAQQRREEKRHQLWHDLRNTRNSRELEVFLVRIERLENLKRHSVAREELCRLRLECVSSLLDETEGNLVEAQRVLTNYLLPLCMRPRRDIPLAVWNKIHQRQSSRSTHMPVSDAGDYWMWRESYEARELLEKWFQECPSQQRAIVRTPLLSQVHTTLQNAVSEFDHAVAGIDLSIPFHIDPHARDDSELSPLTQRYRYAYAAMLTLISIGYRDVLLDDLLGSWLERDDAIGSLALGAFASLGVPQSYTMRVQAMLRRQTFTRPQAHIAYAFQELADATQFDAAQLLFERSVHQALGEAMAEDEASERNASESAVLEDNSLHPNSQRSDKPKAKKSSPGKQKTRLQHFRDWHIEGNASLINKLFERHPNETEWHNRLWNTLWSLHNTLAALMGQSHATFLGSGGKFIACNSGWMPHDVLLFLIPSFGNDPGDEHHAGSHFLRSLALEALEKRVQPQFLIGLGNLAESNVLTSDESLLSNSNLLWLKKDATFDTHYQDNRDNSLRSLKRQAWRLLLSLELQPPIDWLQPAFEQEKSGHVRGDVCKIAAHLRWTTLPKALFALTEERFDAPRQPPLDEFLSRMGVQRLLASACTRPAFDALLRAGFTMDGDLMAATMRHLGEAAFWLQQEGDQEVLGDLIQQALQAPFARQREAAAGALRILAERGCISVHHLPDLLTLAQDNGLAAYSRAALVEAIGYLELDTENKVNVLTFLKEAFERFSPTQFPRDRVRNEYDLGWYTAETLVKLQQWEVVRAELLNRLCLEDPSPVLNEEPRNKTSPELRIKDRNSLDNRSSTVLGLLWRQQVALPDEPWSAVMTDILRYGPLRSTAPLLKQIKEACLEGDTAIPPYARQMLGQALLDRIRERQSAARAEVSLFEPLAAISPYHLLTLDWKQLWQDWLPDARLFLAEAIGTLTLDNLESNLSNRALEFLRGLMGDGTFAVRRAAFRALRAISPSTLWIICDDWVNNSEAQLRQQAAEAISWLPDEQTAEPESNAISQIPEWLHALSSDREREVREATQRTVIERRKRQLANQYIVRVETAVHQARISERNGTTSVPSARETNAALLTTYRYGRALIHVGQDDHLSRLRQLAEDPKVAPHIRHWLEELIGPLESNWTKVTQKWPQPWLPWEGDIEEIDGFVWVKDKQYRAHFSLSQRPADTSQGYAKWDGAILPRSRSTAPELLAAGEETAADLSTFTLLMQDELKIIIPSRPPTRVYVTRSGTHEATFFGSNDPYPLEL